VIAGAIWERRKRSRLEACQPLAETFGVHEDLLVWRTRGSAAEEQVLGLHVIVVVNDPSLGQGSQAGRSPRVIYVRLEWELCS
jgi:hypothetical protein